jgi:hypothetical protein
MQAKETPPKEKFPAFDREHFRCEEQDISVKRHLFLLLILASKM